MGYGIVASEGNKLTLICHGVLRMEKVSDHGNKLKMIFDKVLSLINQYHPDELAIEAPFFGKNVQSMLKLGRAQGVAIAASLYRDVPYTEYAPRKIKQSITGKGTASKEQVAQMIQVLLKMEEIPKFLDATDGLAAAVCHSFQKTGMGNKSYSGWEGFLAKNPGRKLS